jgi:hypothetical protein
LLLGDEVGAPFADQGDDAMWTATQSGDVDGRAFRLALTKEYS